MDETERKRKKNQEAYQKRKLKKQREIQLENIAKENQKRFEEESERAEFDTSKFENWDTIHQHFIKKLRNAPNASECMELLLDSYQNPGDYFFDYLFSNVATTKQLNTLKQYYIDFKEDFETGKVLSYAKDTKKFENMVDEKFKHLYKPDVEWTQQQKDEFSEKYLQERQRLDEKRQIILNQLNEIIDNFDNAIRTSEFGKTSFCLRCNKSCIM